MRELDVEALLSRVGLTVRNTTAIVLAIAGNALKAFPGVGTLGGGVLHAIAYGLVFDSLGNALAATLAEHATLDAADVETRVRALLAEPARERVERVARLALEAARGGVPRQRIAVTIPGNIVHETAVARTDGFFAKLVDMPNAEDTTRVPLSCHSASASEHESVRAHRRSPLLQRLSRRVKGSRGALFAALLALPTLAFAAPETYRFDPVHTQLWFSADHQQFLASARALAREGRLVPVRCEGLEREPRRRDNRSRQRRHGRREVERHGEVGPVPRRRALADRTLCQQQRREKDRRDPA